MAAAPKLPAFVHLEDDEVYPFKAAYEATAEQLRMARAIFNEGTGNDVTNQPSERILVGVLNAFATNFAALTISRRLVPED